jgi:hypothetical protein
MISSLNLSASGCHSIAMTIVLFMEQSTAAVNTRTTETHTSPPEEHSHGPKKNLIEYEFHKEYRRSHTVESVRHVCNGRAVCCPTEHRRAHNRKANSSSDDRELSGNQRTSADGNLGTERWLARLLEEDGAPPSMLESRKR